LRSYVAGDYEVVGFIDTTLQHVGSLLDGIPIVGSQENIRNVAREYNISDIIFAPENVSYASILSLVSKTRELSINVHLVPSTLEVIIGKGSVDSLNEVPLVQISYNIERPSHRIAKRLFDLVVSILLLASVYPILRISGRFGRKSGGTIIKRLPSVVLGTTSLVGPKSDERGSSVKGLSIGKPGLTGLVQLQSDRVLTNEEIDQLNLYYARNQSVMMDLEILIKTWVKRRAQQRMKTT
jgi:lipopolysaccharide/colanic/teichoic acid biosynthesis glycosyltransferase